MTRTIYQWEEILKQQVSGGDILLGQIPLGHPPYDQADMDELGRLLSIELRPSRFNDSLNYVKRKFPLSFALYLVLHGIYSYDSGEYWPKVDVHLNYVEGFQGPLCGEAFRDILAKHNLPAFEHIEGLTNLVPILAHGGLPNASLERFFHLLEKSTKESLIALDAEALMEEWNESLDEKLYFIGKPGSRFISYGGAIAEDFINRCLMLLNSEKPEESKTLQLPERVVDAYWLWRAKVGTKP